MNKNSQTGPGTGTDRVPLGSGSLSRRPKSALAAGILLVSSLFCSPAWAWIVNGTVWEDENMNAIRVGDSEPNLADVALTLYTDPDCDATTLDGTMVDTANTDVNGLYSLDTRALGGAGGGCYQVVVDTTSTGFNGFPPHRFATTANQPFLFVADKNKDGPLPAVDFGYAGRNNNIVIIPHTTPHLVLDSNKGGLPPTDPTQEGPEAFTVAAQVCNPLGVDLQNVNGYIGRDGGMSGIDDNMAGAFTPTQHNCDGSPASPNLRLMTLDELQHGETDDASRFIGLLLSSGECVGTYFQLAYPTQDDNGVPTYCASNTPADDLIFPWDVWATGQLTAFPHTEVSAEAPDFAWVRSMQSASQNKINPGGSSGSHTEVNTTGDCSDPGDSGWVLYDGSSPLQVSVGQSFCVRYVNETWGLVNQGFDADNNGAADYDAWNQPIGESAVFDPNLVQLIAMDSVYSGACGGENIRAELPDNPYETRIDRYAPTGSCAPNVTTTYRFIVVGVPQAGDSAQILTPYQEVASGSNNEKYNGDICPNLQKNADPLTDLTQEQRAICVPLDILPPIIRVNKRNYISANRDNATTFEQRIDFDDKTGVGQDGVVNTDPVLVTYELLYQNTGTVDVGDNLAGQENKVIIDDDIPLYTEGYGRYVEGSADTGCNLYSNYSGATCQPGYHYSPDGGTTWVWTVFESDACSNSVTYGTGPDVCPDIDKVRFVLKQPVPGQGAASGSPPCPPISGTPLPTQICDGGTSTDDEDSSIVVGNPHDGVGTVTFQVAFSDFGGEFGADTSPETSPTIACPQDVGGNPLFCGVVQNIAEIRIGEGRQTLDQDDSFACIREGGRCASTTTAVLNNGFGGYISDSGQSIVWWRTDAEAGTAGFYLERKNESTGKFERLNQDILRGQPVFAAGPGKVQWRRSVSVRGLRRLCGGNPHLSAGGGGSRRWHQHLRAVHGHLRQGRVDDERRHPGAGTRELRLGGVFLRQEGPGSFERTEGADRGQKNRAGSGQVGQGPG